MSEPGALDRRPILSSGLLLGVGMGGFVDGIVFHQILQLHNMLSAVRPPTTVVNLEINMFWDGLFHAFTWITTALGLALLWRAGLRSDVAWSTRTWLGAMAMGWGLFNLVEGLVDHHLLGVHHVVEGPGHLTWDIAFLGAGVALLILGLGLARSGRGDATARPAPS
ncbi:DUF2243 domain-containing protein [Planctomyces sp. SH-PL62]|uniref:DUF2243 domain-containing protein n=1 Tax=Planctomyces sp. SH-PL62 TaxID=1636152 RepID=UPI00078C2F20|nr:DUF2243 domain-containing protein [Planctomyces sp. SH-PL62]AMV38061.1 hypothetical protein VT85_11530 [Planctomyces sp. SH-PL62]